MKNSFSCHVILFGQLFYKMMLSLKSRKLSDTIETKKTQKNIGMYIISVPGNQEPFSTTCVDTDNMF